MGKLHESLPSSKDYELEVLKSIVLEGNLFKDTRKVLNAQDTYPADLSEALEQGNAGRTKTILQNWHDGINAAITTSEDEAKQARLRKKRDLLERIIKSAD